MDQNPTADDSRAAVAAESIRRYWGTIVVSVLIFAGIAAGYETLAARSYVGEARDLIRPLVGNAFSSETSNNAQNAIVALETEAQLVKSSAVGHRVSSISASSACTASHALGTVLTNTQLIQITYTANSARTAQVCAEAFAKQYLAYRHSLAVETQQTQLTNLDADAKQTSQLLLSAVADTHRAHPPVDAESNVRLYSTRLAAVQAQISVVQSQSTQPGTVQVHAVRPPASGVNSVVLIVAGGILGLFVGLLLAVWRGSRRHFGGRRGPVDVGGLPTLVVASSARGAAPAMPVPDVSRDDGFRVASVALLAATTPEHRVIAVTSAHDLKSLAAVSFRVARGLAESGYRVVAVDSESREPGLARVAGVDGSPGLAEILAGRDFTPDLLAEADGVRILGAGELSEDRISTGRSVPRMRDLIAVLRAESDFVIVSTPSLDSSAGLGQLLSVDGVLLVVDAQSTDASDIVRARHTVARMDIEILGTIVNRRTRDKLPATKKADVASATDGKDSKRAGAGKDRKDAAETGEAKSATTSKASTSR